MKCKHSTAAYLESVVRASCKVDPDGMEGLASAALFENDPLLAAYLALLPHRNGPFRQKIELFLAQYYPQLSEGPEEMPDCLAGEYPYLLSAMVHEILEEETRK